MSFLTPFFLLGGLAIAAPIIYHLVRRTTKERFRFSSLMFLLPSPPRLSKRHRLEHWLLLLLRCLALALLAFGFSRPFFKESQLLDPTSAQPKRMIILVDTSSSMRRAGLWEEARARAEAVLRRGDPTDQVALFVFDRQARALISIEEWNRTAATDRVPLAIARLGAVAPTWSGTHLGNALITAAEALAENENKAAGSGKPAVHEGPRQIVLISDLQAGSRLDALQAYEWPKGVELLIEPLTAKNPTNAGVQLVAEAADAAKPVDPVVRVRVTNAPEAKREQFKVGWATGTGATTTFVGNPIDAYVPPGQSRVFNVPLAKGATAEQIILRGDDEDFDNSVNVIPPVQQKAQILWIGGEAEQDTRQPLFFARRAFFDTPRLAVKVTSFKPDASLPPQDLQAANVVFVSDAIAPATAAALRAQALEGKIIVFVPKSPEATATLRALTGSDRVELSETKPANYAMFAEIDFRHPLFAPFSDPRFSDFTKISVWKYRRFDATALPEARAIAKFDSGDPAVVEVPVGKGRVFVLATSWSRDDSQIATSSKFVPLLWSWLELGGGVAQAPAQYFVGDAAPSPNAPALTQPGVFDVPNAAPGAAKQRYAVNLDPNESRTAPLSLDELEELGLPVAKPKPANTAAKTEEKKALLQGAEAEGRQKLWRWFIVATLAILFIESAIAGWTARRNPPPVTEVAA